MTFTYSPPPVVLDASAAIDRLRGVPRWQAAFAQWAMEDRLLLAPTGFLAEVANGLMLGSERLSAQAAREQVELLLEGGAEVIDRGLRGFFAALALAETHALTVYDALYLQLALDVEGELATEDKALRAAAVAAGVTLVD